MLRESPRCFADSAWTLTHPELRETLRQRVRSRFGRARAADHSDVVQEALDAALNHRVLLKRLSPPQRSNWFWVVIRRLSAHLVRRSSKATTVVLLADSQASRLEDPAAVQPASALAKREDIEAVRRALATLPEAWRQILALRDDHPHDWSAVAARCGLSIGAARALWYRALAGLKERLCQAGVYHEETN